MVYTQVGMVCAQVFLNSAATHLAMLTFLESERAMNGSLNSSRGYGRSVPERMRLGVVLAVNTRFAQRNSLRGTYHLATNALISGDHSRGSSTISGTGMGPQAYETSSMGPMSCGKGCWRLATS